MREEIEETEVEKDATTGEAKKKKEGKEEMDNNKGEEAEKGRRNLKEETEEIEAKELAIIGEMKKKKISIKEEPGWETLKA